MKIRQIPKNLAIEEIVNEISNLHAEGSLLILLSGGSSTELGVKINSELSTVVPNRVTFSQIDERYGEVGHENSNWANLLKNGFNESKFPTYKILDGTDINSASLNYQNYLSSAINDHKFVVGIFGIGSDGHTAGILPYSTVLTSPSIVAAYSSNDFERITITPAAIKNFTHGYCLAYGPKKQEQISLLNSEVDPSEQPAQLLKKIPLLAIYTDPKSGELNSSTFNEPSNPANLKDF